MTGVRMSAAERALRDLHACHGRVLIDRTDDGGWVAALDRRLDDVRVVAPTVQEAVTRLWDEYGAPVRTSSWIVS